MNDSSDRQSIDSDDFSELMRRVRQGSQEAVWDLVDRYQGHIRRAVRRVLNRKLRSKFDSMDFVQLAWKSFFRLPKHAARIERPEHLVKYVAAMACNKLRMEARHRLATQKHDVEREVCFRDSSEAAVSREPEPIDVSVAKERWEQMLQDQPSHYRQIIELKLQGHSFAEIGSQLELDPQTARRFLKRLAGGIHA